MEAESDRTSSGDMHFEINSCNENSFRDRFKYKNKEPLTLKARLKKIIRPKETDPIKAVKRFVCELIPILSWLPNYKVKKWLLADLISGLTVGIMHIPQGMSYSILAGQHPIYGLYNSFFPVILYCILGTSRHTSMGTFALTSLMLGNVLIGIVPDPTADFAATMNVTEADAWQAVYDERIALGSAIAFFAGIFLFCLSILHVGSIVIYLSDPMISGFTFGAANHIVVSQFKSLLGVSVGSYSGPFNLIWILRDLVLALVNLDEAGKIKTAATVIISAICIIFLAVVKELNERYKEKIPLGVPLPGEMVVVIIGTGISYAADLSGNYGVAIIGRIPIGIPVPTIPAVDKFPSLIGIAIPVAIVGYSVAVSIAKIFGNKFGYEIRPNQELVAYGVSNIAASFFFCVPSFPSMSRSCVQVDSGGKTQLVGFISSTLMLLVLLVIGPLFQTIPRACLGAIIVVAMKGMLKKALDLKVLYKNKLDMLTWIVAAAATLFLDVVYGLCVGVGFTLLCVVFRTQMINKENLQRVGNTEIYRDADRYDGVKIVDGVCIFSFHGPLHYLNKEKFRRAVLQSTNIDPVLLLHKRKKAEKKSKKAEKKLKKTSKATELRNADQEIGIDNETFRPSEIETSVSFDIAINDQSDKNANKKGDLKYLILDFTHIPFTDSVGIKTLTTITDEYAKIGIKVLLTNCSDEIFHTLNISDFNSKFGSDIIFITIHDAIRFAQMELDNTEPVRDPVENMPPISFSANVTTTF